jgi:hypothetical protein
MRTKSAPIIGKVIGGGGKWLESFRKSTRSIITFYQVGATVRSAAKDVYATIRSLLSVLRRSADLSEALFFRTSNRCACHVQKNVRFSLLERER